MRHLWPGDEEATLRRGKSVEQFLGGAENEGVRTVKLLELRPKKNRFEVWLHHAEDFEGEAPYDLYEAILGEDETPIAVFEYAKDAIAFAHRELGARADKWTNLGMAEDEYADFLRHGRPAIWPWENA